MLCIKAWSSTPRDKKVYRIRQTLVSVQEKGNDILPYYLLCLCNNSHVLGHFERVLNYKFCIKMSRMSYLVFKFEVANTIFRTSQNEIIFISRIQISHDSTLICSHFICIVTVEKVLYNNVKLIQIPYLKFLFCNDRR